MNELGTKQTNTRTQHVNRKNNHENITQVVSDQRSIIKVIRMIFTTIYRQIYSSIDNHEDESEIFRQLGEANIY